MKLPPPLKNDCFAMPQGTHWAPVDAVLAHLRAQLHCVVAEEIVTVPAALGRVLAAPVFAERSHPPSPNSAVDGYGIAGPVRSGLQHFKLMNGRSAAGVPFAGNVPDGHAIRILTGANLPDGVDTVVMQEDVLVEDNVLSLHGPMKRGANARAAGEDMLAGAQVLAAGRVLTAADLGTLTAVGVAKIAVRRKLRVGVLSTGDELRDAAQGATEGQIFDANRPMLAAIVTRWGYALHDLGRAPDDRDILRRMLDEAAKDVDVILTSGGASAGDEDHMSALLEDTGSLALWRVAIKPGRPLAMGMWGGVPVLGLPGNPVAAMVCTLLFARPMLQILAGRDSADPQGFMVPAAFTKIKKAGRREYLRARIEGNAVQVFASEGSGRISGMSWAEGLVELADEAAEVTPGDLVRFVPYGSFGL